MNSSEDGLQDRGWIAIQQRTFTGWANQHLSERMLKINDLGTDLEDGILLINLLEQISAKTIQHNKKPKIRAQKLENNGWALKFLKDEGIKLVNISGEDIVDSKLKLILGLIWTIILRYHIQKGAGSSAKNELLEWVRKQIPECDVKNFTESWRDGTAICHLTDSLERGTVDLNSLDRSGNKALENATLGEKKAEEVLGIPMILAPSDMVSPDSDELSVMTYISYFRDYAENAGKRKQQDALEKIADPSKCTAFGPGLEHAETDVVAPFTIQAKNQFNRNVPVGGENFDVEIKGPKGNIECNILDNGDGTYSASYVPRDAGRHFIQIKLKEKPINGSPWNVPVDRSPADESKSTAEGPGLISAITGEPAPFKITARNKLGEKKKDGGDPFKVEVKGPFNTNVQPKIVDNKDGTYDVTYVPLDAGDHVVEVTLNGKQIKDSPFKVPVRKNQNEVDALNTTADGPGLKSGTTSEPSHFTVTVRNGKGEKVLDKEALNQVGVEVFDKDGNEVPADIKDNNDGTLSVSYQPLNPGQHRIDVVVHAPHNPVYYEHIKNSPFFSGIEAGTDPSKSSVYGPGLTEAFDTKPAVFHIQAKDRDGKDLKKGGDPFEVKVLDKSNQPVPAKVKDNGDGTYDVEYAPNHAGDHTIHVTLKDKPVANSPYKLNVKTGASHDHSHVESYSFVIRSKTKENSNKTFGGEKFEALIKGPDGKKVQNVKISDIGDGTYVVVYSLPEGLSGEFSISVTLDGKDIKGSPWKQVHH